MATRDDVITRTLLRMARSDDPLMYTIAESLIGTVQSEYVERMAELPWFLLKWADPQLTNEGANDTIVLPEDFLQIPEAQKSFYMLDATTGAISYRMRRVPLDTLLEHRLTQTYSQPVPVEYDIVNDVIIFGPQMPTEVYTFKLMYYGKAAALTSGGSENAFTTHASDLLSAELGIQLARVARDKDAEAVFVAQRNDAQARIDIMNTKRLSGGVEAAQMLYRG